VSVCLRRFPTLPTRFVFVQQVVTELGDTAIEFPPMQAPASFNLSAVKAKIDAAIGNTQGSRRLSDLRVSEWTL
jgi:hypothetical protein